MIKLGLPGSKGCVRVKDCTVGDGVVRITYLVAICVK